MSGETYICLMLDIAPTHETLADVLGLVGAGAPQDELALIALLRAGLPRQSLARVAERVAPDDRNFRFRLVPRATLARKAKGDSAARLSAEQSARVVRLAKVWEAALDVWKSEGAARDFLGRPHPLLGDMTPLDVTLQSEFGWPLVKGILGRLRHGSAV